MYQQIHPSLGKLNILTPEEHAGAVHGGIDRLLRERYRGIEAQRLPTIHAQGNGGTLALGALTAGDPDLGPAEGDIWMLRRVLVASNYITNPANVGGIGPFTPDYYQVFRGSTPSDIANAYAPQYLLDGIVYNPPSSSYMLVGGTPPLAASGIGMVNSSQAVYAVTVAGGVVSNVTINGQSVGTGDGTYYVPIGGIIAVTYSAAPTLTWTDVGATAAIIGQRVGIAYNAGTKSVLLQPGEQIYAQVFGSNTGVTYTLTGEAIRVPAEMKGKLLA
jgi:hypothetical protein